MPKGYPKTEEGRRKQRENLAKGRFREGQVANPLGRPRRPMTMNAFIKEMEEKGYEIPSNETICRSFIYEATLPEDELKAILNDKNRPMMQRIIAKGVLDKKGIDVLERIINRAYGQKQLIDITSNGKDIKADPVVLHLVTNNDEYRSIQAEIAKQKAIKDNEE